MSSSILKVIVLVVMIVYCISPIDLVPGPIDDLIVVVIGVAARRGLTVRSES